jgi:hypothetical protein
MSGHVRRIRFEGPAKRQGGGFTLVQRQPHLAQPDPRSRAGILERYRALDSLCRLPVAAQITQGDCEIQPERGFLRVPSENMSRNMVRNLGLP